MLTSAAIKELKKALGSENVSFSKEAPSVIPTMP